MNTLDTKTRALILRLLVEGNSIRATTRTADVSKNTVTKLLEDAGKACAAYHDEHVRSVTASHVQADEIWSFCYAKERNVAAAKSAPEDAGDIWTWTAMDRDSKLMISYTVGDRSAATAREFMFDLADRLATRVQLTTDGHGAYLKAVADAFSGDVDYAMLIKLYGDATGQKGLLSRSKAYTAQGTVEVYNVTYDARNRLTQQNWIVPGTGGGTFLQTNFCTRMASINSTGGLRLLAREHF